MFFYIVYYLFFLFEVIIGIFFVDKGFRILLIIVWFIVDLLRVFNVLKYD